VPTLPLELTIFISHSSADVVLARAIVELIEKALKLPARQIRCTSVEGYKLPVGADTDEQLRREIFVARAFVGLITPTSAKSAYVLFELGARWGAKRQLAPVLARGADASFLGGPLGGINALTLSIRNQVLQLIQDIAEYLELPLEPMASFQSAVDAVVTAAGVLASEAKSSAQEREAELSEDEVEVLKRLAMDADESTAEQVAKHLKTSEQKAKYFLGVLDDKGMVGVHPVFYGVTTYFLTQEGRTALVTRGHL
jgi:hypothetical protein